MALEPRWLPGAGGVLGVGVGVGRRLAGRGMAARCLNSGVAAVCGNVWLCSWCRWSCFGGRSGPPPPRRR